ncbi:MAG: hypothetical protein ABR543_00790 [Gemmatimonadaceae bacterium]
MAARIRRELKTEVDMVRGHYGEYKVLVDGDTVIDGGAFAALGVLPSGRRWSRQCKLDCRRDRLMRAVILASALALFPSLPANAQTDACGPLHECGP